MGNFRYLKKNSGRLHFESKTLGWAWLLCRKTFGALPWACQKIFKIQVVRRDYSPDFQVTKPKCNYGCIFCISNLKFAKHLWGPLRYARPGCSGANPRVAAPGKFGRAGEMLPAKFLSAEICSFMFLFGFCQDLKIVTNHGGKIADTNPFDVN